MFYLKGPTAYVIIQEKMTTMIWNPETGDCYEQFNVFCPLQSADCLINNENVSILENKILSFQLMCIKKLCK